MIYSLHVFDRHCNCVFSRNYAEDSVNSDNFADSAQLLFGALYLLRNIAHKLGLPPQLETEFPRPNRLGGFATPRYRAHTYDTASGMIFCLILDPQTDNLQGVLHELYSKAYVETVVKNAAASVDLVPGEVIALEGFRKRVDEVIQSLPVA